MGSALAEAQNVTLMAHLAPTVVVVMPTFNEVDNVRSTVEALMACHPALHVLVVDDDSPDGTALVVEQLAREQPGRVHLERRIGERGLASAYQAGFAWALQHDFDLIVQMDADGSHPAARLPAMISAVTLGGADLVVGSRYVPDGGTRNWPLRRRLLSRLANFYARTALHLDQRDLTGAFRVWRREALAAALPVDSTTNGFSFLVEMAALANRRGLRVEELPIIFVDRQRGSSKMTVGIAVEGLGVVWHMRTGKRALAPPLQRTLEAA